MRIYIVQKNGSHVPAWRKFLLNQIWDDNFDDLLKEYNSKYIGDYFDPNSNDPTGPYIEFASKEDYVAFVLKWG